MKNLKTILLMITMLFSVSVFAHDRGSPPDKQIVKEHNISNTDQILSGAVIGRELSLYAVSVSRTEQEVVTGLLFTPCLSFSNLRYNISKNTLGETHNSNLERGFVRRC